MARFLKSMQKAKGAPPGSMVFLGEQKMDKVRIRLISYDKTRITESEYDTIEEALNAIDPQKICWLNIDGLHDGNVITKVGDYLDLSSVIRDSIVNTGQRAKYYENENQNTIISKAIYFDEEEHSISFEQISFIFSNNLLVSFQEKVGDHFDPVRNRLRSGSGKSRQKNSDYLAYILLDCLVDNYLITIEQLGNKIEQMEHKLSDPSDNVITKLFHYKTEITYIRKILRPFKEVLIRVLRNDSDFIDSSNTIFFQELYDLVAQAQESAETYYTLISDSLNIYNTNVANRANDVMKVLTIFASIFIPLTFIAGVYGTNFDYVPELKYRYSYFIMWIVMLIVTMVMLIMFKRKKWF